MAPKVFQLLISFVFLLVFLLPLLTQARPEKTWDKKPSPPFGFLKHLQGCHKGENVKGLHELKKYLHTFGYLNYPYSKNQTHDNDDDFDDLLEAAIKMYQFNYHLTPTGNLDAPTVSKMMMPRCGVADKINGNGIPGGENKSHDEPHSFHLVSRYTFFPGNPRWPTGKTRLTYAFRPGTRADAAAPVARAFNKWASASRYFTFARTQGFSNADITISFDSRNHGDGNPFDGAGGILAHAYAPTDGRFHYDADERWSDGAAANAFDLETVALHEIGHLLGLGHSNDQNAIMFPSLPIGATKNLNGDDIRGINALYN